MGTLNICLGINSFSFFVKALPTPYAWKKQQYISMIRVFLGINEHRKIKISQNKQACNTKRPNEWDRWICIACFT